MSTEKRPSVALVDPLDSETTRITELAHQAVLAAVRGVLSEERNWEVHPVQYVRLPSGDTIILEAHGQPSFTAHGKQGLRPERLAFLRSLGCPVYLVFFEGMTSYRSGWLHDMPAAIPVSLGDPTKDGSKRYGWPVSEMEKTTGALHLPDAVPEPNPRQEELA